MLTRQKPTRHLLASLGWNGRHGIKATDCCIYSEWQGLPSTYPSLYDINIEQDFVSRTFELRLYTIILPFTLPFSLSLSPQRCAHWAGNNNDKMHLPWLLLPSIEPSDPPCSPSPSPGLLYTFPASYHHHRVSIRFFFAKSSERTREPGGLAREQQKTYTHTHTHIQGLLRSCMPTKIGFLAITIYVRSVDGF